jgi:glutamine amidotransferase
MITIVNYGMGNLSSIQNMLKRIGHDSLITSEPKDILNASKLILPGVGAFDRGISNLRSRDLIAPLNQKVIEEKVPTLGICLGMQMMTKRSDEGEELGLGWIDAETKRFQLNDKKLKVPHMGWNSVSFKSSLVADPILKESARFYFVHSFYVECRNKEDVFCETSYGMPFHSGFMRQNIIGVQFHPEKSHKFGMTLLKTFAEYSTC